MFLSYYRTFESVNVYITYTFYLYTYIFYLDKCTFFYGIFNHFLDTFQKYVYAFSFMCPLVHPLILLNILGLKAIENPYSVSPRHIWYCA